MISDIQSGKTRPLPVTHPVPEF